MRRKRTTDKQITNIEQEFEATDSDVSKLCEKNNISVPMSRHWSESFSGTEIVSVDEVKSLRSENERMRKLIVDRDLELDIARVRVKDLRMLLVPFLTFVTNDLIRTFERHFASSQRPAWMSFLDDIVSFSTFLYTWYFISLSLNIWVLFYCLRRRQKPNSKF